MLILSKKGMNRTFLLLLGIWWTSTPIQAQESPEYYQNEVGIELQAYPAGFIPGLKFTRFFSPKDAVTIRIGYQFINHQDFGVQDNETGNGFGGTLGYRRYFSTKSKRLFAGVRCDLWQNKIDWIDYDGAGPGILAAGTSNVTVLQPTAEIGYEFQLASERIYFAPAIGFGYEVNIKTEGAATGQGAIFLLGFTIGYRF